MILLTPTLTVAHGEQEVWVCNVTFKPTFNGTSRCTGGVGMPKAAGLTPAFNDSSRCTGGVGMPKAAGLTLPLTVAHGEQEVLVCLKLLV